MKILLVDDEPAILEQIGDFIEGLGHDVVRASSGEHALELLEEETCRIALVDLKMPGMSGLDFIRKLREQDPSVASIIMTAYGTIELAVLAVKSGVHDFLIKPVGASLLQKKIEELVARLTEKDRSRNVSADDAVDWQYDDLVGNSPAMQKVYKQLKSAASSDLTVLIYGETGTGKELAASAIHENSQRNVKPLVALNCAACAESLLEAELFGSVKGAYTGAVKDRKGKIASADKGTLLLDEISAATLNFQSRLLRVLEERRFSPVGSDTPMDVDIRVIASMNIIPERAVDQGSLRQDLYYRLNVLRVDLPPLRERLEDIPVLVTHFVRKFNNDVPITDIPGDVIDSLKQRDWPGNVRELKNTIGAALVAGGGKLTLANLPSGLSSVPSMSAFPGFPLDIGTEDSSPTLRIYVSHYEKLCLEQMLEQTGGNVREAALKLDITERNLRQKITKYEISLEPFRSPK